MQSHEKADNKNNNEHNKPFMKEISTLHQMRIKGIYIMDIMSTIMTIIVLLATFESYLTDLLWSPERNYINIGFLLTLAFMKYSTHRNNYYITHGVFAFGIANFVFAFERELQKEDIPKL